MSRYVVETVKSEIDASVTLEHYELKDTLVGSILMTTDKNLDEVEKICSQLNDHYNLIVLLRDNNMKLKNKVEELGGNWYDI